MNKQEAGRLGGRPRALTLEEIRQQQALGAQENKKEVMGASGNLSNNRTELGRLYTLHRRSSGNRNKTKVGVACPH
jgi:hypothetical protein